MASYVFKLILKVDLKVKVIFQIRSQDTSLCKKSLPNSNLLLTHSVRLSVVLSDHFVLPIRKNKLIQNNLFKLRVGSAFSPNHLARPDEITSVILCAQKLNYVKLESVTWLQFEYCSNSVSLYAL